MAGIPVDDHNPSPSCVMFLGFVSGELAIENIVFQVLLFRQATNILNLFVLLSERSSFHSLYANPINNELRDEGEVRTCVKTRIRFESISLFLSMMSIFVFKLEHE
jgi:hypothetical protein